MAPSPCMLLDFACYKPPAELRVIAEEAERYGKHWKMYKQEHIDFMFKVFAKSGLSPTGTYLPACIHPKHTADPRNDITSALKEAEMVMTGALSELLEKQGMKPTDIDILVTCTSIFCPTPSAASMLVNRFKMRADIQTYHLGGMGCGTGVVGINLIRDLLKARPNSIAVFVPSEITSYCFYDGQEKNRMVANVIFRMGGAAAMFTNKASLRPKAKYELMHAVRVHHAANDDSYGCMSWGPDKDGVNGVYLGKNVITCAGTAIEAAIRLIAPKILTWKQYREVAMHLLRGDFPAASASSSSTPAPTPSSSSSDLSAPPPSSPGASSSSGGSGGVYGAAKGLWGAAGAVHQLLTKGAAAAPAGYLPDFTQCVDHFAIHAGGYAVLKGIQERLKLPTDKMIPSFATLHEYGNTSCSTTWYALGYTETCENVKRGQVVLQLGVGGGIKCGAAAWRALRDISSDAPHATWAHLKDKPLTEADLARSIDTGDLRGDPRKPAAGAEGQAQPGAAAEEEEEVEAL